jgi:hypothetical protein
MKNNKAVFYFSSIFLIHILVCFFKLDRDFVAFQEHPGHPHQSYSEQPLSKNIYYFSKSIPDVSRFSGSSSTRTVCNDEASIWTLIVLSYNSQVRSLLKQTEVFGFPGLRITLLPHKHDLPCDSSDGEEPGS